MNTESIARSSVIVYLTVATECVQDFVKIVKQKYRIELTCDAAAIGIMVGVVARDGQVRDAFEQCIEDYCRHNNLMPTDEDDAALVHAVLMLGMVLGTSSTQMLGWFEDAQMMARVLPSDDIEREMIAVRSALAPTDIPPPDDMSDVEAHTPELALVVPAIGQWSRPRHNGLMPLLFDAQDAFEGRFPIDDSSLDRGIVVSARIADLVHTIVRKHPKARSVALRIELKEEVGDAPPLNLETTSSAFEEVCCPVCGEPQSVPHPCDAPSLFAGDPFEVLCVRCGNSNVLRIEQTAHVYLRTKSRSDKLAK